VIGHICVDIKTQCSCGRGQSQTNARNTRGRDNSTVFDEHWNQGRPFHTMVNQRPNESTAPTDQLPMSHMTSQPSSSTQPTSQPPRSQSVPRSHVNVPTTSSIIDPGMAERILNQFNTLREKELQRERNKANARLHEHRVTTKRDSNRSHVRIDPLSGNPVISDPTLVSQTRSQAPNPDLNSQ